MIAARKRNTPDGAGLQKRMKIPTPTTQKVLPPLNEKELKRATFGDTNGKGRRNMHGISKLIAILVILVLFGVVCRTS